MDCRAVMENNRAESTVSACPQLPVDCSVEGLASHAPASTRSAHAVFLDRDGVINKVVMRDEKPCSPRTIHEFQWEEGSFEAVRRLKARGFSIIVVTNQPDMARGKLSGKSLNAMTEAMYSALQIDSVMICPHDNSDGCSCRKPKPGMLIEAAKAHGIDFKQSFMVGDTWKDMEAGRTAGCTTILLDRAYNQGVACDYRTPTLDQAVRLILELHRVMNTKGGK